MFGLFKKRDNGNVGSQGEKTRSVPRPGPWGEASILMDQGRVAEALEHFARTAIQTRDLSHMDMAERWLGNQALLDKAGEEAVCLFVAYLTQVLDPLEPVQRQRLWDGCLNALRALGDNTAPRRVHPPAPYGSDRGGPEGGPGGDIPAQGGFLLHLRRRVLSGFGRPRGGGGLCEGGPGA